MLAGPVVVNNTPLVALHVLGRLDLLGLLYSEVLIPPAVRAEFLAIDSKARQIALEGSAVKLAALQAPRRALGFVGIDQGEAEVLTLAQEIEATLVVLDDRKARRFAQHLGLPLTGTIGLLLLAKAQGFLEAVAPAIDQLVREGLYFDPQLVLKALALAGED